MIFPPSGSLLSQLPVACSVLEGPSRVLCPGFAETNLQVAAAVTGETSPRPLCWSLTVNEQFKTLTFKLWNSQAVI